jgi:aryl-alcohol dehydrogenase-like predicted oxidoreductase
MKTRKLGQAQLEVSALGFGCMGMSMFYGDSNDVASIATLQAAMDQGVTFFDTAELYGNGHNETLLGRAIRGRRHELVIATKCGLRIGEAGILPPNGRPEYIAAACDASLKRLNIDCIDLYYQHRMDPAVPVEDTVGALARLVTDGKVRYIGLSEAGPVTLRRAMKVHPITALQSEYSLWSRDVEPEILPVCRALGIGFVAYSPLSRGFLAGQFKSAGDFAAANDGRSAMPRFSPENFPRNQALVTALAAVGKRRGMSPAQLALAWLLAQGEDIVPIPGTRQLDRLAENNASLACLLTADDLAQIEAASPAEAVAGLRLPEQALKNASP